MIFIVGVEPDNEYIGMTTTSIMCFPQVQADGTYEWSNTNKSWTNYDTLHYKVIATGHKNGFTTLQAKEYIWSKETDTPVYIREIIGVTA